MRERIVMSGFGTASVGLSAGYWNVEGNAFQVIQALMSKPVMVPRW